MKVSFTTQTPLTPAQAAHNIVSMRDHRVPFTIITQEGSSVCAVTKLGPLVIVDNMEIHALHKRASNVRGRITKTGPILSGTLEFSAVKTARGTLIGWRQNLTFLPCPILDPALAVVMRVGYGLGFKALLRA